MKLTFNENNLFRYVTNRILSKTVSFFKEKEKNNISVDFLPDMFKNYKTLSVRLTFSKDKDLVIVNYFNNGTFSRSQFAVGTGNPTPGISLEGTTNGTLVNCEFEGNKFDYAFVLSHEKFGEMCENLDKFLEEFMFVKHYQRKIKMSERLSLVEKSNTFKGLIDTNIKEKDIEEFLTINKEILELTLHLESNTFIKQPLLVDAESKYNQDLVPDLIAYNTLQKKWTILDYKKTNESIVKNHKKVRSGVKAIVTDLTNQLRDYIEYFEENVNRKYVLENYNCKVEKPHGIGIIGRVTEEEMETFDRYLRELPGYLKVYSYNMISDDFERIVTKIKKYN